MFAHPYDFVDIDFPGRASNTSHVTQRSPGSLLQQTGAYRSWGRTDRLCNLALLAPRSRSRAISTKFSVRGGRRSVFPFRLASRTPAFTRSRISDRSRSAIASTMWNITRPDCVYRSKLSRTLRKATPRESRSVRALRRCLRDAPKRSNFQHSTTSKRLGHSRIQTTLDLYTDEDLDEMIAAQDKFIEAVGFERETVQ